jgi:sRNA-binding carbon storage regulator CsrA
MLVLELADNDSVLVNTPIGQMTIRVSDLSKRGKVKLAFDGDRQVFKVDRQEVLMKRQKERAEAAAAAASDGAGPPSPRV